MDKLLFNDSFDYGIDIPLVTIVDDPDALKKCASVVTDEWGHTDPIKGHSLIHLIAMGDFEHTGSNRNSDAWMGKVLEQKHATFKTHGALYRNHKSDPEKKEGFVAKTAYNKEMGRVELMVAASHDKCADWLSDIESGTPTSFSIGFRSTHPGDLCFICGNFAKTRDEYCGDLHKKAALPGRGMGKILPDGRKCFVFNDAGYFNDISKVPIGADAIAMDLRKVASLSSEEVIGGAELAEQYFIQHSDANHAKIAMIRKLADIEKKIECIGHSVKTSRKRALTKVACDTLRSVPTKEMFYELVKLGAILPMSDFYQVIFGNEYSNYEAIINKAAAFESQVFSKIASDNDRLLEVSSNTTYDPAKVSHVRMDHETKRAISSEYSIDPDLAAERAIKRAALLDVNTITSDTSPQDDYLINQYGAYKLSALLSISPEADDEVLFSALI